MRFQTLAGGARAASSSYIAPERFDSPNGRVALDLMALKTTPAPAKAIRENEPPRTPIREPTDIRRSAGRRSFAAPLPTSCSDASA